MTTAANILLIIVSSVLSLFLLILIVTLVKLYAILRNVHRLIQKAEQLTDSAEAVGNFFRAARGPVTLGKFVGHMAAAANRHGHSRKD